MYLQADRNVDVTTKHIFTKKAKNKKTKKK